MQELQNYSCAMLEHTLLLNDNLLILTILKCIMPYTELQLGQ